MSRDAVRNALRACQRVMRGHVDLDTLYRFTSAKRDFLLRTLTHDGEQTWVLDFTDKTRRRIPRAMLEQAKRNGSLTEETHA